MNGRRNPRLEEKNPWYGDTKTKKALKIRPFRYTQQNPFRTQESQRTYHISYVYIYMYIDTMKYIPYRSAINDRIISWFNFLPPFGGKIPASTLLLQPCGSTVIRLPLQPARSTQLGRWEGKHSEALDGIEFWILRLVDR